MVTVTKLAHVGFRAQNLSNQAEFYNDRWGLERIDEHAGEIFFRADGPDHHVLTLHSAETPGLHHFAFEVGSVEDLDRAAEELAARGLRIITPPTADLEPGVARAMRFRDPEGNLVELVAGVDTVHDPYGNRDVKPVGLNHVVLEARDRVALESFYRDVLGFKLTDQLADFMTFFRCNANHHSLAFIKARDGEPAFNHAAFEIRNWEEWIKAVFYAGERGIPRVWGPGRHLAGNNLFSYYKDPENNTVEYTSEVEQITTPDYAPKLRNPPIADQWQTVGPSGPGAR
ncbi:MAG: VOC family protein [Chloroflexi bacterium]|nr:VOC family protein [Chloroflexota bacterium]